MEEGQWTTDTTTTINDKAVPPSSTQTTGPSLHASSNQRSRDGFVLASRELPMSGANQSYSVNLKICSKTEEHKNSMNKKKETLHAYFWRDEHSFWVDPRGVRGGEPLPQGSLTKNHRYPCWTVGRPSEMSTPSSVSEARLVPKLWGIRKDSETLNSST